MKRNEAPVSKAVITRTKDGLGRAVVEVDGVRIGVAQRHGAALGRGPWWTLWIDEPFRADKNFVSCPAADVVKELAMALYSRAKARESGAGMKIVELRVTDLTHADIDQVTTATNAKIKDLAADVKKRGILKPLWVRKEGNLYRVIDGFARWKAAILAGLDTVPALIEM